MKLDLEIDTDASMLRVGTILRRQYNGEEYVVEVVRQIGGISDIARERGWWRYRYMGRRWKTLSAIAYEITGDRYMSGNRFFGLRKRRGKHRPGGYS